MAGLKYEPDGDESDTPDSSEFKRAAEEAFPDEDWGPPRLAALKALMKLCMGGYEGEADHAEPDGDEGEDDGKHKAMLGLLFGKPVSK